MFKRNPSHIPIKVAYIIRLKDLWRNKATTIYVHSGQALLLAIHQVPSKYRVFLGNTKPKNCLVWI